MHLNGKTSALNQRWRCSSCGKTKTEKPIQIQISDRVLEELRSLPQIKVGQHGQLAHLRSAFLYEDSYKKRDLGKPQVACPQLDGWTIDYLIEQILRNYLGIEADYDSQDLAAIKAKQIVV